MHLQVYKEPLCRRYFAAPCSCATIYYVGALVTLLLTPFFMVYDSNKFWAKMDTYLEQPEVTFTKQLLLLTEGLKGGEAFSASFATVVGMNHLNHARVRAAVVKSFASDTNSDGLVDRLVLNARLPLNSDEEVTSVKMLAFFRTRLRDRVRMEMDNLAYFEGGSTLAGEALRVEGNFRLRQTWPLSVYGGYTYPYVDDPLLDPGTLTSAHEVLFSTLLGRQAARNSKFFYKPLPRKHQSKRASIANLGEREGTNCGTTLCRDVHDRNAAFL
ncbi:unnamed protein product [Ascophyllum nodosum]